MRHPAKKCGRSGCALSHSEKLSEARSGRKVEHPVQIQVDEDRSIFLPFALGFAFGGTYGLPDVAGSRKLMIERGLAVDHCTIGRWVLPYEPELHKRICREIGWPNRSWRVDESYV